MEDNGDGENTRGFESPEKRKIVMRRECDSANPASFERGGMDI